MTLPATIYARFSNADQAQGNSKARQLTLCRDMLGRHGWEGSPDRELIDEGVSAYSGANRASGGLLHTFEQEALAGRYKNGHVLVVENLDRISRQGYDAVLPFLQQLTSQGVTVATVDGDRVYPAYERVTMVSVIEAVVKSELSREESEKKSRRLKAAQNKRVSDAQVNAGQHISSTATVPAWIDTKRISKPSERPIYRTSLNEARVAVLREIFQLTIDGFGTPAIAKILNGRGEPVWKHRNIASKNGWTVGYLTKIVLNRAVMGEYHPMNRPRSGEATSKGIAVLNHYPQGIDPVTFAKAAAARDSRKGTSGAWQITHNNLFSGIAKCGVCGGRMKQEVVVRKGGNRRNGKDRDAVYQSKQDISYLKCHNALNRVFDEERGLPRCSNRNWVRYEKLEQAVVQFAVGWLALNRQSAPSADIESMEVSIADARRFLADKQKQADNAAVSFTRTGSTTMERLMLQLEVEVAEDQKAIQVIEQQLSTLRTSAPPPDFLNQIEQQRTALYSDDETERTTTRVAMKQTLGSLIKSMECDTERNTHVILAGNSLLVSFDNEGELIGNKMGQGTVHLGPHGEIDWHPDFPDVEYEIHPEAL
ncbi:DNA invertase Pin-like site-specific DNA recombinase [Sphingomonas sp. PP-CE-1A-559]|uniref:recombinase family protein n=1 Tax=Sphingomonas sp. PP-CE-1A-559 TaxID=2135657 RepID=UPI001056DF33|nr:recombinase family protein [Sphingomonas sp. PP-CE-1A-559]TCP92775.1 DNA invertase Pin-like site-specific DNA recombinase [Sphingomonas sp. PP-CE-1A-559]